MWWRAEKVNNARANNAIAKEDVKTSAQEGYKEELERLQAISAKQAEMTTELAVVKAQLASLMIFFKMLTFCPDCQKNNAHFLGKVLEEFVEPKPISTETMDVLNSRVTAEATKFFDTLYGDKKQ